MTDRRQGGDGRIDLRAIDSADRSREDRILAAAMARIAANPARDSGDALPSVAARFIRPAIAAAAVLAAVAVGTIVTDRRGAELGDPPAAMLASWVDAHHVPTNAELLMTFQGYGGGR